MAGRPVPAESTRASRCDALVPPSPPPLTWMRPVPSSASTPASAERSASVADPARARRRDHLAALADNDHGVAVLHAGTAQGIPHRLGVVMGVMIDEPGGDDTPRGVDGALGGGTGIFADPDDLAVLHRDIRDKS